MRKLQYNSMAWLSDIPKGWTVMRLKDAFTYGKGLSITKADLTATGVPVISYGQIHSKDNSGTHLQDALLRYVPESFLETDCNCLLKENDFVFADTSEDLEGLGNCAFIDREGCIFAGYHTIVFRPQFNAHFRYLAYLFKTDVWRGQFRSKAFGIKVYSLSQRLLNDCSIILPPLPEQRAIADYLDEKCGAIDAAIVEAKKGIEEYKAWKKSLIFEAVTGKRRVGVFNAEKQSCREAEKMKHSGIPWIGAIPEGWMVVKGKYLLSANSGIALRNELLINIGNYPVFGGGEVIGYTDNWNCDAKTILIGRVGARCGCVTLLNDKSWATDNALIVSTNEEPRYLSYLLIGADLNQYNSSNAQPLITAGRIRKLMFPYVDDKREQQAIADYLDEKCATIDAMVAEKEALIADLEAYKKSLIYETVTGKREVA